MYPEAPVRCSAKSARSADPHPAGVLSAMSRDGRGEHLLADALPGRRVDRAVKPAVGPYRMEHATQCNDPLVVPVLVTRIGVEVCRALVALRGGHPDVGGEARPAIGRAGRVDVRLRVIGVVTRVL